MPTRNWPKPNHQPVSAALRIRLFPGPVPPSSNTKTANASNIKGKRLNGENPSAESAPAANAAPKRRQLDRFFKNAPARRSVGVTQDSRRRRYVQALVPVRERADA